MQKHARRCLEGPKRPEQAENDAKLIVRMGDARAHYDTNACYFDVSVWVRIPFVFVVLLHVASY